MRFITGLLFTFICLLPAGSMAQNKVTLSGKVIDQHGTPIAQATIAVENTTSGTYTDDRGKYSLQVAPGKHTFVVSFLGYQTVKQSLDIRQDKKQNFTLQESAVTLSSVEVYGKTQTQKVKEGYNYIEGKWLQTADYIVIHRIAIRNDYKGNSLAKIIIDEAIKLYPGMSSIRIDTHDDNLSMQRFLTKNGFTYCGTIYLENKETRRAYERIL